MPEQEIFSPVVNSSSTQLDDLVFSKKKSVVSTEENIDEKASDGHQSGVKLLFIMIALMLSIFLASTDETIVATALGAIVDDFGSSGEVTWIAASYLLTMTAFQPLYGKFSDIFGRKITLLFALTLFLIGSIGCGLAPSIIVLIIFRAFAGIGSGGLISLSFIIISDVVPMVQRGVYQGIISATFALANVAGPLLGGVLTDYVNWRWVFYINIPIVVVAAIVIVFLLPKLRGDGSKLNDLVARVDFLGTIILVSGTITLTLGLNWGGRTYPWSSAQVISCIVVGAALLMAFILVEKYYAKEPVIPGRLFTRNAILASVNAFMYCIPFFSTIYYWPLYHQTVQNKTAFEAGLELLPALLGVCSFSVASGLLARRFRSYRPIMRFGSAMILVGVSLMALLRLDITRAELVIYPLLIGGGIGFNIQLSMTCSQLAVAASDAAMITSFISFAQTLGGVFGLAIVGSIYNNVLFTSLTDNLPGENITNLLNKLNNLDSLSSGVREQVIYSYLQAYRTLFLSMIPFCVIGFICTLAFENIPLQNHSETEKVAENPTES
ncbi:MFS general substrate transporter [Neoconidiobolus thromboides FSU 785]|nr:MFS general substrate transporter [Neoconidiobolus thromboides FSU 785]